ncbi:MAG: zinc-ribbon domain-containing protein [Spirochaetes bacterium]|nr:zinc-ribbon domain-containing protein [Spirochaetota bacterium]
MIVRCSECNAAYQVDDEKVENKRFAFTCPKCKTHVIIDNRIEKVPERSFDQRLVEQKAERKPEQHVHTTDEFEDILQQEHYDVHAEKDISKADEDLLSDIESFDEPQPKKRKLEDEFAPIESETIDLSDFSAEELKSATEEIQLPEEPLDKDLLLEGDIKSDEIFSKEKDLDESITIDLDTLDIPLDESTVIEETEISEKPSVLEREKLPVEDIDFDDILVSDEEIPKKTKAKKPVEKETIDDITLDLDSLDIQLEEHEEVLPGEQILEEDEKLTLEDAGLTIDELIEEETKKPVEDEEDLKLSLDEIEPGLTVDDLHKELTESEIETIMSKGMDLPEVDLDKFEMEDTQTKTYVPEEFEYAEKETIDSVPAGFVNVTVDFALSYSRTGAALRLLGVYFISLLPHIIVNTIYSVVSSIVGFLNWCVILFTRQFIDDFADIQQNTLRYCIAIIAYAAQIIEDKPVYAGRPKVEHSLQLDIVYPSEPSRLLAFLRITVIGILIAALPHLLLLVVLTLGMLVLIPVGLICIIATKRWPSLLFDFMYRYYRYYARVSAYIMGLVDKYPSFIF